MTNHCCACKYKEPHDGDTDISFHKFPRNEQLKSQWLAVLKRNKIPTTEAIRICSKHFMPSCFVTNFGRVKLLNTAVPTIFSPNLQHSNTSKKIIKAYDKERHNPNDKKYVHDSENFGIDLDKSLKNLESLVNLKSSDHIFILKVENPLNVKQENVEDCDDTKDIEENDCTEFSERVDQEQEFEGNQVIEELLSDPETIKEAWKSVLTKIYRKNNQIKVLRIKNKRLTSMIKNLESQLTFLQTQNKDLLSLPSKKVLPNSDEKKRYECIYCKKKFRLLHYLRRHLKSHTEGTGYLSRMLKGKNSITNGPHTDVQKPVCVQSAELNNGDRVIIVL